MNVAVIGANGQLGRDVVSAFAEDQDTVASVTHADLEISQLEIREGLPGEMQP